jgi:hypothetical protein
MKTPAQAQKSRLFAAAGFGMALSIQDWTDP